MPLPRVADIEVALLQALVVLGMAKGWGNQRIACFQISDSRCDDHGLGKVSIWIK